MLEILAEHMPGIIRQVFTLGYAKHIHGCSSRIASVVHSAIDDERKRAKDIHDGLKAHLIQITLEDVPHKYQERLLNSLKKM